MYTPSVLTLKSANLIGSKVVICLRVGSTIKGFVLKKYLKFFKKKFEVLFLE